MNNYLKIILAVFFALSVTYVANAQYYNPAYTRLPGFNAGSCATNEIPKKQADGTWDCSADSGAAGGDSVSVNSAAVVDPDFVSVGSEVNFVDTSNTITVIIKDDIIAPANIDSVDVEADEECLTYEATGSTFEWQTCGGGGGGAPTDVDYLVGTADATLSGEIVVGTTPGGVLGGTWASPTLDDDAVTIAKIADANLSGSDTTVITGTAGTSTHCAQWNADGDLVTSGATCGGSGLSDVVDDTTPELGGNLDGGGFTISNISGLSINKDFGAGDVVFSLYETDTGAWGVQCVNAACSTFKWGTLNANTGVFITGFESSNSTTMYLTMANTRHYTFQSTAFYPVFNGTIELGQTGNRWEKTWTNRLQLADSATKPTCTSAIAGEITYEVAANVGTFYGCQQTGASTYAWVALH